MEDKITNLKFADDVVLVVENPEELNAMLRVTEEYSRNDHLQINGTKTKVMVFRNGGKLAKNETWKLNGTKLEVVNEYKYLGFWFSTRGTFGTHAKNLSNKARLTTNRAWRIMKRAKINTLQKRLCVLHVIGKSGGMYGVELLGWNLSMH